MQQDQDQLDMRELAKRTDLTREQKIVLFSETYKDWFAACNEEFEKNGLWNQGMVAWRDGEITA